MQRKFRSLWICLMVTAVLFLSYPALPRIAASSGAPQIFLPFVSDWNGPFGTSRCGCNQLYSGQNFVGYGGGYGLIQLQEYQYASLFQPFPGAYGFGGAEDQNAYYLGAFGHFSTAGNSFGFLTLFDTSSGCCYEDWSTPFLIKANTHLSVWFVHSNSAGRYTMIDALVYDQRTGEFEMLGDYANIVDQHGTRLNAAYRGSDPYGSNAWTHAVFDLNPLYNTDRNNWFVMKIFVRFDNSQAGSAGIGDADTFFGDVRWTYGMSYAVNPSFNDNNVQGTAYHLTTIEYWSWSYNLFQHSLYDLGFKVTNLGWSHATHTWTDSLGGTHQETMYPYEYDISSPVDEMIFPQSIPGGPAADFAPTGVNLTSQTSTGCNEYCLDAALQIISLAQPEIGTAITIGQLAYDFYMLSSAPSGTSYTWPFVNTNVMGWDSWTALTNNAYAATFMQTDPNYPVNGAGGWTLSFTTDVTLAFYDPSLGTQGWESPETGGALSQSIPVSWSAAPNSPSPYPSSTPSSYPFPQNDCGVGVAGTSFTGASSSSYIPGSCTGYLNNVYDTQDWYQFYAANTNNIAISVTPPSNTIYNLELYNPSDQLWAGMYPGSAGTVASVSLHVCNGGNGNWRVRVDSIMNAAQPPNAGLGTYSLSVSVTSGTSCSGGGGCVLSGSMIELANGTQVPVQYVTRGMLVQSYDTNVGKLVPSVVSSNTPINTTSVLSINNGQLYASGPNNQRIYVLTPNGTMWIPLANLQTGMMIFEPLSGTWIPVSSLRWLSGSFTVYDITTYNPQSNDYIANGILMDTY